MVKAKIKVAMITDYYYPDIIGGAEISQKLLAEGLFMKGVEVHIFTRKLEGKKEAYEVINGVKIHRVLNIGRYELCGAGIISVLFSSIAIKRTLAKYINNRKFDILHVSGRNVSTGAIMLGKDIMIPTVLHIRDYWLLCQQRTMIEYYHLGTKCKHSLYCIYCHFKHAPTLYGYDKKGYKLPLLCWAVISYLQTKIRMYYAHKADYIIAISDFVRYILVNEGYSRVSIKTIYNPVDLNIGSTVPKKNSRVKIVYAGRLSEEKGIFLILVCAKKLSSLNFNIKIIGDGPLKGKIVRYIKKNSLSNVQVTKKIKNSDLMKEYKNTDILIVPSLWPEPFGRSVIEGMSNGLCVITSGRGGIGELISNNYNGIIFDPSKEDDLCIKLRDIIKNDVIRNKIRSNSKNALNKFDINKIVNETISTYENLINA